MKKISLLTTSVVTGLFLAGCGESLPKEITEHANFKSCQQVEKNLLTIQSSFEKDDRVQFYRGCINNEFNNPNCDTDSCMVYADIFKGKENFEIVKNKISKKAESMNELVAEYQQEFYKSPVFKEFFKQREEKIFKKFKDVSLIEAK